VCPYRVYLHRRSCAPAADEPARYCWGKMIAAEVEGPSRSRAGCRTMALAVKSMCDIVLAAAAVVVALPLFLVIGSAILLLDGRPVLFSQERVGRHGVRFRMYKFRTMVPGAEEELDRLRHRNEQDGPLFKLARDPRVTRSGRVLRAFSLDELPQLFNVLRGEMSLVGPRPALPDETTQFDEEFRALRQRVRPGITGLWQIQPGQRSFVWYQRCDRSYVERWTLRLDAAILLLTLPRVLRAGCRGVRSTGDGLAPWRDGGYHHRTVTWR
jgi:lipopolysaccharide/colanic/teichoic acid biosynthesis glycosyltransferase